MPASCNSCGSFGKFCSFLCISVRVWPTTPNGVKRKTSLTLTVRIKSYQLPGFSFCNHSTALGLFPSLTKVIFLCTPRVKHQSITMLLTVCTNKQLCFMPRINA